MHFAQITAYDAVKAGILDASEIEDAKRALPENVFKELYLAEPSDDGLSPFGYQAIDDCIMPSLSTAPPVCYGVDLAKSVDWTVIIGLDKDGAVCRFERWQADWPVTQERLKAIIGDTPALIDSTGVGDPVVDDLKRTLRKVEGFKFTSQSKQMLMEGLAVAIQSQTVRYVDHHIAQELRTYEYTYTRTGVRYEAPSGLHDDCVCALALAVQMKHNASKRVPIRLH
ncbi:MAG: phage terminase large subunit family protein [Armatimonadota bacterium]